MIELFLYQMVASAAYVAFRAMQQLNCVYNRWLLIFPTSLLIAWSEVYVIKLIANSGLPDYLLILAAGLGGTVGCFSAMKISNYLKRIYEGKRNE